ncbi:hypothetical protein DVK02_08555 [Halobellus sp. Atlit-31R]|nr:hypothetical protein DVK02_08555 [Halobellus sp. Atlit-31R]
MGLKCRLLGHAYGEPEVERSREEQGDEVVVTIREVQVCERCGDEQVVSQNKEVTAIRSPEEVGLDETAPDGRDAERSAADSAGPPTASTADAPAESEPGAGPDATPSVGQRHPEQAGGGAAGTAASDGERPMEQIDEAEPNAGGRADGADVAGREAGTETSGASDGWETGSDDWGDVDADPDADDAVILDGTDTERDETQWPEETDTDPNQAAQQSAAAEGGDSVDEDDGAVTNDAEIIDADDEADAADEGRAHGEWPKRDDDPSDDAWPEHEASDEGFAATADDADGDVELGGSGLTPEVNGRTVETDGEHVQTVDGVAVGEPRGSAGHRQRDGDANTESDDGFARARDSKTLKADVPDERVEFYCPNCGYARVAGASSMRAGDICPECKKGYIAERER